MKILKRIPILLLVSLLMSETILAKEEPKYVNLTILGTLISPTKGNGKAWDGFKTGSKKTTNLITSMLLNGSTFGASEVVSKVGDFAIQGSAAPDVIGYVSQIGKTSDELSRFVGMKVGLTTKKVRTKNSYMPNFDTEYKNWPLYKGTRFRIRLYDMDLVNHDDIGNIELNYNDIISAVEENKPKWINVSKQGGKQLLLILISAIETTGEMKPDIKGHKWVAVR